MTSTALTILRTVLVIVAVGLGAASALHRVFGQLHQPDATIVAIIGWMFAVPTVPFAVMFSQFYFTGKNDPMKPMAPAWGLLGLTLWVALLGAAGIGVLHSFKSEFSWGVATGIMDFEFAVVAFLCVVAHELNFVLTCLVGGNGSSDGTNEAFQMIFSFIGSLIITLVFLETFGVR